MKKSLFRVERKRGCQMTSLLLGALFVLACGGSKKSTETPSGELTAESAIEEIKGVVQNICACETKACLEEISEAFPALVKKYEDAGIEETEEFETELQAEMGKMAVCVSEFSERLKQ